MLVAKNKIKKETEKAYLIFSQRGPFHEIREVNGREIVCKIFYQIESWVPKRLCIEKVGTIDVPESFLSESERIVPWH